VPFLTSAISIFTPLINFTVSSWFVSTNFFAIFDEVPDEEQHHCCQIDMRVWEIGMIGSGAKLLIKPGDLEKTLRDYYDEDGTFTEWE